MTRKVVLTCAVVGETNFNRAHPNFPITPKQIADSAREAEEAGASAVHLHVRNPVTGEGSSDPDLFLEMATLVRDNGVKAVMNVTCGGGGLFFPDPEDEGRAGPGSEIASAEARVRHIEMILPEMCSLDVCTQNQTDGEVEYVYLNTQATLRKMARRFQELGVKPEIEVFAPGDILLANRMLADGLFDLPPMYQIVMGTNWGLPATPETMIYMRNLLPAGANWAAFGIARMQMPMVAQSVLLGGNVRVGLEDNLYLKRGVFATNGQLVARARTIIESLGFEVATPDEAREILGLRKR
ncbi:3-keto-5-aminohexanoate cleavage protein [Aestuariivirga sp. YIM B02566]|uniref:3-keto-5-aminohexanoate cleavage protein n=1 Tax=Taklimakanibacter albus TaxID=2800327 RepID=A0ACC5R437_9HYPH|nr:3-keto-5-aminohexanoate cleavage protein [Aestuariivirga sp. YIM B02566]MBK1867431.1 3-keto-5-aminohexanoate cleavage protein [Aestuariivirga sp. YIM B02566]